MDVRGGWAVDEQGWEQAPQEAQALTIRKQVWTEGMVYLGARAGLQGPGAKCFEKRARDAVSVE